VPLRHGRAVPRQVVSSVPHDDVGQAEHRRARLEVDHQAIEHVLQALDSGLGHVHVDLGGAQRLVTEDGLDGAQRDAGFEQVRRVAVPLMRSSA